MIRRLAIDRIGATAAEFALVLPLLILFLLGMLDIGRAMWTWNRAEKATQMAVRYAVVTDMVPEDLEDHDFALSDGVPGGSPVPTSEFDSTTCDSTDCTGSWGYDSTAFGAILQRAQFFLPETEAADLEVRYDNVGLGFAGDPNGPDVAPLVTVRLTGVTFQPLTMMLFAGTVTLPDFKAALTLEDGSGSVSN